MWKTKTICTSVTMHKFAIFLPLFAGTLAAGLSGFPSHLSFGYRILEKEYKFPDVLVPPGM